MRAIQMRDYNCHLLDTSNNNDNFVLKFNFFFNKNDLLAFVQWHQ